jgi:hypothetical protein
VHHGGSICSPADASMAESDLQILPTAYCQRPLARSEPRRNEWGAQLCERCPRRLNQCKGTKHRSGAGLVCQGYYDKYVRPQQKQQLQQLAAPVQRMPVRDTLLLQMPERLNHLEDTARTHGIGKQGRSRNAEQNTMMSWRCTKRCSCPRRALLRIRSLRRRRAPISCRPTLCAPR